MTIIRSLTQFETLIESGKAPANLTLDLKWNNIGANGAKDIAAALSSGKAPANLTLNLGYNSIGDNGAKDIAAALSSGKAPANLTLSLEWNSIGANGAKDIAAALSSGKAPANLTLNLKWNSIGDNGAKDIAAALSTGKAPTNLTLNLGNTSIGANGAKDIAAALSSGNAPANLTLNLGYNIIGANGAKDIAAALSSGKAPANLTLNLEWNSITSAGVKDIIDSLLANGVPEGLRLHFGNNIQAELKDALSKKTKEQIDTLEKRLQDKSADITSLSELFSSTMAKLKVSEALGDNTDSQRTMLWFLYFQTHLDGFNGTKNELDELLEDFKKVSLLMMHTDNSAFLTMHHFALVYDQLHHYDKKYQAYFDAIRLANTPEDKNSCEGIYTHITQHDKDVLKVDTHQIIAKNISESLTKHNLEYSEKHNGVYFSNRSGLVNMRRYHQEHKTWSEIYSLRLWSKAGGNPKAAADDCFSKAPSKHPI